MEGNSTNRKLYITAILYIVSVYVFAPLFFYMNKNVGQDAAGLKVVSFALPFIFGLINLIAVLLWSKYADRDTLLTCAVMVKYALIPFYILGAICIALVFLLIFTPAVIMIFLGPAVIAIMCVLGWLILVMGSPYAIAFFIRSEHEGCLPKPVCALSCLLQFIFTMDVFTMMIMSLKERKWRAVTIALLVILALALMAVACLVILIIVGAFNLK